MVQSMLRNENHTRIAEARSDQLNSMAESLEIDNNELEEMMCQKTSNELAELPKPTASEYRRQLLGRKTLQLKTNDIKMEEVFGMLQMDEVSLQREVILF